MKAEPVKAIEYIGKKFFRDWDNMRKVLADDAEQACKIAFEEGRDSLEVMDLEWKWNDDEKCHEASTPIKTYKIFERYDGGFFVMGIDNHLETIDIAKQACRYNFACLIKLCLKR